MDLPKHSSDTKSQNRSDVLSVLQNLESMFHVYINCLNGYAENGILVSLALEAHMLSMKLDVMADRWHYHIPFKEAASVDFYQWGTKVESWSKYIHDQYNDADLQKFDSHCPDKHFLLDLYTILPNELDEVQTDKKNSGHPYYTDTNMSSFIVKQEQMHKTLSEHWTDYLEEFTEMAADSLQDTLSNAYIEEQDKGNDFPEFDSDSFYKQVFAYQSGQNPCFASCTSLNMLAKSLYALNDSLERKFSPSQFTRLAERIFLEREYEGRDTANRIRAEVAKWTNETPDGEIPEGREKEMRKAYDAMCAMKFRNQFSKFVTEFTPDLEQKKNVLGKFLFNCRTEISKSDLIKFMEHLFHIIYMRKDQLQDEASQKDDNDDDTPPVNTPNPEVTMTNCDIYLSEQLLSTDGAKQRLVEKLYECEPYICRQLELQQLRNPQTAIFDGWTWRHIHKVFEDNGFILKGLSNKDFFHLMALFLKGREGRTESGIQKGFYNNILDKDDPILPKVKTFFSGIFPTE